MNYSPADVLRTYLLTVTSLALSLPSLGGKWPVFVGTMPDDQDSALCIYDTQGIGDGRIMKTGQSIRHPGLMIRARGLHYRPTFDKMKSIGDLLDTVLMQTVIMDETTQYLIQAVSTTSDIIPLGEESHKRRESFVLNGRITLNKVEG